MKKKEIRTCFHERRWLRILLKMKVSVFLVLALAYGATAKTYSQHQKVSIEIEKASILDVLNEIKSQTGLYFIYKQGLLDDFGSVSVEVKDEEVKVVLDQLLNAKGIECEVEDEVITFKKVEKPSSIQQQGQKTVKGQVVDEKGNPLPGVAVQVQGTYTGVSTDEKGRYEIPVKASDVLKFTFIGYKTEIILVEDKTTIDIQLKSQAESIEEVSVVAFGEQKKESVVSSITTVKAGDLKSSNSDLTSSFAGKISGIIGWDTGGAPGALTEEEMNTQFYIRGMTSYAEGANTSPLILLDGIEVGKLDLARIDPDDIESFNVMKDASATAMYGARGANGVIYVKTKKGVEGNVRTTFRYEKIWSMPTDEIDVVSPREWMELYNESLIGRGLSNKPFYSREKINNTGNPDIPSFVYPNNDWYKQLFKDYSVNNHYGLNIRGGGAKVQYYASLVHNADNGMIKTDPLNQFDANITNKQTNLRLNMNVDLTKSAKLNVNSFTTYDKYHGTIADVRAIYALAFNANPVEFAATYPEDKAFTWPHVRFGGRNEGENPYAEVQKGYRDRVRYSTVNQFEWIQNLTSVIKGLEFRGTVALTKNGYFDNAYKTTPALYTLQKYDYATKDFWLKASNPSTNDSKLTKDVNASRSTASTTTDIQARLLHTAAWDVHQTSFTAVMTARNREDSSPGSVLQSLPYRNIGIAFRGSYGYKDKYFIESSLGVNGSERFAAGNRIGYFPSIGGAWVASKEEFLRPTSHWLKFAKLRLSYGLTGNDGVIGEPRFLYLEDISGGHKLSLGPDPASQVFYSQIVSYPKHDTKWETNEQTNLGLDIQLFDGIVEFNTDIYRSVRHNIYDYRNIIPASVGLVQPPLDNYGKVLSRGLDFSGKIQHAFSNDLWFILNGTFTYNKATYLEYEEPENIKPWQSKIGNDLSQRYAYVAEGLFQDWSEIQNAPRQSGDVQPGDIRYKDIDGNGSIDINDAVLAGHPTTPSIIYGLNLFLHYKQFEFSMGFQGAGNRSIFLNPEQLSPLANNHAVLRKIADSHWTESNHAADAFWPKLSTKNIVAHNMEEGVNDLNERYTSTFFMKKGRFLRCTNIEFTYYVKKDLISKYNIDNLKFFARANNPFLFSDFDLWDIELGGNGFNYPKQKTFSVGMNLTF